jgi:hypothetical protein
MVGRANFKANVRIFRLSDVAGGTRALPGDKLFGLEK